MEYYHLLTIFYEIAGHQTQFSIWFPSYDECWNVLLKKDSIYTAVNGTAGFCDKSEVLSKIVKPLARPW